ncbi:nuclear transport factor 2 family protein [Streptomyces albiaxialis]|uniref:Nuclear transport factor 2 family protein n=1 Tax=Streptomyces albiaxialis TaxID=329523 RepID=A0ABN2WXR6_9ACTN
MPEPSSSPHPGTVESRVRHLYEVFNTGELTRMLDYFAPDVEIVHPLGVREIGPGIAGVKRGHDEARAFFEQAPRTRGPMRLDPDEFLVAGNRVVVFGTREVHSLDGRSAVLDFVHSWTLADGKVTRFEDHFDTIEMCRLLRPEKFDHPDWH